MGVGVGVGVGMKERVVVSADDSCLFKTCLCV